MTRQSARVQKCKKKRNQIKISRSKKSVLKHKLTHAPITMGFVSASLLIPANICFVSVANLTWIELLFDARSEKKFR